MSRSKGGARGAKPRQRESKNTAEEFFLQASQEVEIVTKKPVEQLKARTDSQHRYMSAIKSSPLVFATGPAGTGKTYICGAMAAEALDNKQIDKIIITRPVVEAGESLGFLPGELEEKFEPFLAPFRDVLNERLGKTYVDYLIKVGKIEAAPLAYMRGRTFKNAWVILDESQNTTPAQMRMFLTRMGENCKMIVNGDIQQKDISGMCGLEDAVSRLSYISSLKIIQFTRRDVVRCGLVQEVVEAYEQGLGADAPIRY
jgi:phosphate starvation-inducible PhoH-like protein